MHVCTNAHISDNVVYKLIYKYIIKAYKYRPFFGYDFLVQNISII